MSVRVGGVLLAIVMAGVLAAALWIEKQHPRRIVATGEITIEPPASSAKSATLRTRTLESNAVRFDEIELPNGTWIGCAGDCRKAAREADPEFWDALGRQRGGR